MKLENWIDFQKNTQTSNLAKIHSLGAELSHSDGRPDVTKLTSLSAILRTCLKTRNCFFYLRATTYYYMFLSRKEWQGKAGICQVVRAGTHTEDCQEQAGTLYVYLMKLLSLEHWQTFFKKSRRIYMWGGCQCVHTCYYSNYGKQV